MDSQQCYQSKTGPLGDFEPITESIFVHQYTRIAASENQLLAIGSLTPQYGHYHAELLKLVFIYFQ